MKKNFIIVIIILFSKFSFAYYVDYNDPMIRESHLCSRLFSQFERQNKIPPKLLQSISLIESGRSHPQLKHSFPWPWAVNIDGKSFYFENKGEAVKFVESHLQFGKKSIDVGCMQINLLHHPKAFRDLQDAFEPLYNIQYAAKFLRQKYEQYSNWDQAIGAYHSANGLGKLYATKVQTMWDRVKFSNYPYGSKIHKKTAPINSATFNPDYFVSAPKMTKRRHSKIFVEN